MNKIVSLKQAVSMVKDNDVIAIGGNVLHRVPHQFVYELVRNHVRNLDVIKTAGAHDVDVLCLGENVGSVAAGFISYETEYGLCRCYRRAVESGKVRADEHACYTVISAIRAAVQGVPFMPFRGLTGSDLHSRNYFAMVADPFTGEEVPVVRAIKPDVAVIHVQEADVYGNARIYGPVYEDLLFAKAAKKVILTAEKIITNEEIRDDGSLTVIPGFMVDAVVELPNGAVPGSCAICYDINRDMLDEFKQLKSKEELERYLVKYERRENV